MISYKKTYPSKCPLCLSENVNLNHVKTLFCHNCHVLTTWRAGNNQRMPSHPDFKDKGYRLNYKTISEAVERGKAR